MWKETSLQPSWIIISQKSEEVEEHLSPTPLRAAAADKNDLCVSCHFILEAGKACRQYKRYLNNNPKSQLCKWPKMNRQLWLLTQSCPGRTTEPRVWLQQRRSDSKTTHGMLHVDLNFSWLLYLILVSIKYLPATPTIKPRCSQCSQLQVVSYQPVDDLWTQGFKDQLKTCTSMFVSLPQCMITGSSLVGQLWHRLEQHGYIHIQYITITGLIRGLTNHV